jgi:hypothetical protein
MSVTVSLTDLAMPAVDEQFRSLVPRDVPGQINCLRLRVMHTRDARIALAPYGPAAVVGYNVLVLAHGVKAPFCSSDVRVPTAIGPQ